MDLLAESTLAPLRVRIVDCPCEFEECRAVYILAQLVGGHEELWLTMGVVTAGFDEAAGTVDEMLANPDAGVGFRSLRSMVERGQAMVGLTWEQLDRPAMLETQVAVWCAIPDWMERLPAGHLWATRGLVFGDDLTRVVRALYASDYYYVPDLSLHGAAARLEPLEQPQHWAVVDHPLAESPVRMEEFDA